MQKKIILLIKSSDFQNYLANKLFQNNLIDTVILEEGTSIKLSEKITYRKIQVNTMYMKNGGVASFGCHFTCKLYFNFMNIYTEIILNI